MWKNNRDIETKPQVFKFGKSTSSSSLGTEPENWGERENNSRKISEGQKNQLIKLITVENFNMKEVWLNLSFRLPKS